MDFKCTMALGGRFFQSFSVTLGICNIGMFSGLRILLLISSILLDSILSVRKVITSPPNLSCTGGPTFSWSQSARHRFRLCHLGLFHRSLDLPLDVFIIFIASVRTLFISFLYRCIFCLYL